MSQGEALPGALRTCQCWKDYGSGLTVHYSFARRRFFVLNLRRVPSVEYFLIPDFRETEMNLIPHSPLARQFRFGAIPRFVLLLLSMTIVHGAPAANDFQIKLIGQGKVLAESSSIQQPQARLRIQVPVTGPLEFTWRAKNSSTNTTRPGIIVHFYVVRQARPGTAAPAKTGKNAVYEGALTLDFDPGETAIWRFDFQLPDSGDYLLQVETLGLAPTQGGRETLAAVDLVAVKTK